MLIPEVRKLIQDGKLNIMDGEWIGRLPAASQLRAAEKCMAPSPAPMALDNPKSSVTHGHPSTQARRK